MEKILRKEEIGALAEQLLTHVLENAEKRVSIVFDRDYKKTPVVKVEISDAGTWGTLSSAMYLLDSNIVSPSDAVQELLAEADASRNDTRTE